MEEAAKRNFRYDPISSKLSFTRSVEDPNAVSGKNAHGLMQLRPSTAKQYGVNNVNDPEENVDAGAHYLADLIKRYDGDIQEALAAYNAGPETVEKYNQRTTIQRNTTIREGDYGENQAEGKGMNILSLLWIFFIPGHSAVWRIITNRESRKRFLEA